MVVVVGGGGGGAGAFANDRCISADNKGHFQ